MANRNAATTVEDQIVAIIIDNELPSSEQNQNEGIDEFEAMVDMIMCERNEKDYEWQSDIFFPEYAIHYMTQISGDAATYFQSRDFVEVYHESELPEGKAAARASKNMLNRTLNRRGLRYYQKYMRTKQICMLNKNAVVYCWWEQDIDTVQRGMSTTLQPSGVDIDGRPMQPGSNQVPGVEEVEAPDFEEVIKKDFFNFDVIDPRRVHWDDSYVYSLQDKKWVVIQYEKTLSQLKDESGRYGYTNMDVLEELVSGGEESRNTLAEKNVRPSRSPDKQALVSVRFGLFWCVVDERDPQTKEPLRVSYGLDEEGNPVDGAELHELAIHIASVAKKHVVIKFDLQRNVDALGRRYRPIARGENFIHPTDDGGIGDGTYNRELQIFINDTINMSNDRVKMATLPTMKGRKWAMEDNETVYFAPEHVIELNDPSDLEMFEINADINGAMNQLGIGRDAMRSINANYPGQGLGNTPEDASTTATAISEASSDRAIRTSYRALTWEYTMLCELYWIITQMTHQYARYETGVRLFGSHEELMQFRPAEEFFYKPVSQNIETEYTKVAKRKELANLIGYLAQVPNPKTFALINQLVADIMDLMGKEVSQYKAALLDENAPPPTQGRPGTETNEIPASNQSGIAMGGSEMAARSASGGL